MFLKLKWGKPKSQKPAHKTKRHLHQLERHNRRITRQLKKLQAEPVLRERQELKQAKVQWAIDQMKEQLRKERESLSTGSKQTRMISL